MEAGERGLAEAAVKGSVGLTGSAESGSRSVVGTVRDKLRDRGRSHGLRSE